MYDLKKMWNSSRFQKLTAVIPKDMHLFTCRYSTSLRYAEWIFNLWEYGRWCGRRYNKGYFHLTRIHIILFINVKEEINCNCIFIQQLKRDLWKRPAFRSWWRGVVGWKGAICVPHPKKRKKRKVVERVKVSVCYGVTWSDYPMQNNTCFLASNRTAKRTESSLSL